MAADVGGDGEAAGAPLPTEEARLAATCGAFVDAAHRFQDRVSQVGPASPGPSARQLAPVHCMRPPPLAVLPCCSAQAQDHGDVCDGNSCGGVLWGQNSVECKSTLEFTECQHKCCQHHLAVATDLLIRHHIIDIYLQAHLCSPVWRLPRCCRSGSGGRPKP